MLFTLISSLPIANTKRVTFSEDGCMSIELVRVLVWVLVWVLFSSSLYPISIYRFFSSFFYRAAKYGKTLRGTTCVTPSSGGGGTSNDMPWRDRDEDSLHFAHRVMLYAHAQYYPVNRHKRTQNSSYSFSYVYRIMGGNISSGLCHSLLLLGILFLPNWQSIKSSKFYNHSYN